MHNIMKSLSSDVAVDVKVKIYELIVGLIDGISQICRLQDSQNKPIKE